MRLILLQLAISALFVPYLAIAKPTIDSIDSINISTGLIKIRGSGFGESASVLVFDQFNGDSGIKEGDEIPVDGAEYGAWTGHIDGRRPRYHLDSHSGRFGARVFGSRNSSSGEGQFLQLQLEFPQGVQEIFLSYWVRLPDGSNFPGGSHPGKNEFSTDSSWKFSWLYDLDRSGHSSDLCLPTYVGHNLFYLAGNDFNLDENIGNSWWSFTDWIRIAVWLRANNDDPTADGDVLFQTISGDKGVIERRVSKPVFDDDFDNGPGEIWEGLPDIKQYRNIEFPGWIRPTSDVATTFPVYDDIYVAVGENSVARVELVDTVNYMNATRVAVQIASSWTDTDIIVDVNQAGFSDSDLQNAYLFVWDKNGVRNDVGFSLGISPYPPSDLKVAQNHSE